MRADLSGRMALLAGLGVAFAVLGLVVMGAWVFRQDRVLLLLPGFLMVFNTAAAFAVVGVAIAGGALAPRYKRRMQAVAGTVLVAIGLTILAQHVFGLSPGIDWVSLHAWLVESDGRPFPGRMSLATGATFLITGAILMFAPRVRHGAQAFLVYALTAGISAVGVIAIVGYMLNFAEIFDAYWLKHVSLPTAIAFTFLGFALWLNWRDEPWNRLRPTGSEDQRIALAGAVVLAMSISATGIAVFSLMQASLERTLTADLGFALKTRQVLVAGAIERAIQATSDVATRPNIQRLYSAPSADPNEPNNPAFLPRIAASLLQAGFSAFAFYDAEGRELARAGEFRDASELHLIVTHGGRQAELLWDGKYALRVQADIAEASRHLGKVRGLYRLPELDDAIFDTDELGATSEFVVCGSRQGGLHCAPSRFRPRPFDVPVAAARRLPMSYARDGDTGVIRLVDYRGKRVLAAYAPLGPFGLGAVLKTDLAELYAPIRGRIGHFLLTLLVASAAGGWLLRNRVRPLVRSIVRKEQQLRIALESSQLVLWDWDVEAKKIYLSEQWSALLGGVPQPTEITPNALFALVHPDDASMVNEQVNAVLKGTVSYYAVEHRVHTHSGAWKWIRSDGRVVERSREGKPLRAAGTSADISERKNRELQIAHLAHHDALTGLPNRSLFRDRLERALLRNRRDKAMMAVMYIDVDKFKNVNDTLGHAAGDVVLTEFSRRLSGCVRAVDTIARLGGDEFAVVLENLGEREDGLRIAGNIIAAMRRDFAPGAQSVSASASVGIAFHDGAPDISAEDLIAAADQALYEAKSAGRDCFRVAN